MQSSLICEFDSQLSYLQQLARITESLKEKCLKLETEKDEAFKKCEYLQNKLERLNNKKCTNCTFLENELKKERKEKEKLKKVEKAKLLKTIAKTLENLDDGNTNHFNQLMTELNCGKLSESPEQKKGRVISLIEEKDSSDEENESEILVNETVIVDEIKGTSQAFKGRLIVIPETEATDCSPHKPFSKQVFNDSKLPKIKNKSFISSKENVAEPENKDVIEQASKKLRLSPILSSQNVSPSGDKKQVNQSFRSPSVLSEIIEAAGGLTPGVQDEKEMAWKMKPGALVEVASTSAAGGKKMKQMTLSLSRIEKKHDISLSNNFRGGVAKHSDDNDIVHPSPERDTKKVYVKKTTVGETLEDPDITVFNPPVTSTCLPVLGETSFDRLPNVQKSPKYKYRRETVRKKVERMRLPGQDCDQCAKYYEAAGLDQSRDVRARLDRCSRHRDKYQLRSNTPPGFWDPVLPASPEDSQDHL